MQAGPNLAVPLWICMHSYLHIWFSKLGNHCGAKVINPCLCRHVSGTSTHDIICTEPAQQCVRTEVGESEIDHPLQSHQPDSQGNDTLWVHIMFSSASTVCWTARGAGCCWAYSLFSV